jgi:hypothetical protein
MEGKLMNTTKRLLTMILICFMLLSLGTFAASYSDVPANHERFEAIDSLSSSDIITGFPDGSFKPDESVTRAQMAALITRMFKLSSGTVDAMPFSDVAKDHWASSNILAAKKMGVINGFPDGTFKPDDKVTYEQAVKMIVSSLNYGSAAEAKGGWPNGYIQQAASLGITKKAIMAQAEPSPRGMIAQLLFNSTTVDMLVPVIKPDGSVEYQKSSTPNTVKDQFLGTKTIKNALVVAIPNVTLGTSELFCQADEIWVRSGSTDIKLKVGTKTNAKDFIGQAVDIDYTENSQTKDLVLARITSKVIKTTSIDIKNIETISNTEINYYETVDADSTKKISIESTDKFIYNERYATNLEALITKFNSNTKIDGTFEIKSFSGYNLIKVKAYETFVASAIETSNQAIDILKFESKNGEASINFPKKDDYSTTMVVKTRSATGDTDATFNSISKGNLVSIAKSLDVSNDYYEIIISKQTLSQGITEIAPQNIGTLATIGGKKYSVSKDLALYGLADKIDLDTSGIFHIDAFNAIGYISNVKSNTYRYGLISKFEPSNKMGVESYITMYNLDSESMELRTELTTLPETPIDYSAVYEYKIERNKIAKISKLADSNLLTVGGDVNNIKFGDDSKYTASLVPNKTIPTVAADLRIILMPKDTINNAYQYSKTTLRREITYTGRIYDNRTTNAIADAVAPRTYILVKPLEKLTSEDPILIVKSSNLSSVQIDGEPTSVATVECYNIKDGSSKSVIFLADILAAPNELKVGDVFSYYKTKLVNDKDYISEEKALFKLSRLETIKVGAYPIDGALTTLSASGKTTFNDFRYWAFYREAMKPGYNAADGYRRYSINTAVEFDSENKEFYWGQKLTASSSTNYLPGDIGIDAIDKSELKHTTITTPTVFVYNGNNLDDKDKLQVPTKDVDTIANIFNSLNTVATEKAKATPDYTKCDTVITLVSGESLISVIVIKAIN